MEQIWLTIPVVIFAGIVRGFSGFGFAAIAVVGLNFFLEPQQSVAVVLSLDIGQPDWPKLHRASLLTICYLSVICVFLIGTLFALLSLYN